MALFSRAPLPTTLLHLLALWQKLPIPFWPSVPGRVEDGAGLCSSASVFPPSQTDVLGPLRKAWTSRLLDSGLHQHNAARLLSGSKEDPLSDAELKPFLDDLRAFLP